MIKRLFGTDGIRGTANQEPITPVTLIKVGRALVMLLKEVYPQKNIKIVIGRDTRISGFMIESALAAGISAQGGSVSLMGEMPTPAIAYTTIGMRADAGIVISASHNPYPDNGVKIFSPQGLKISDEWERRIEEWVSQDQNIGPSPQREMKRTKQVTDAGAQYIDFLKQSFPHGECLKGCKIILDCGNGAAYRVAPAVLEELDANLIAINVEPDGFNINKNCGALYPEGLSQRVLEERADLGIALDGDSDRVIVVDEKGEIRDGDTVMAICANALHKKKKLNHATLVATQMSNYGLESAMRECGIKLIRTDVGDRFVVAEMLKHGYNLGGEQSGHIIFSDYSYTGDGILSALQLLSVMIQSKKKLSELSQMMKRSPQILLNIEVREKKPLNTLAETTKTIQAIQKKLKNKGRVYVRYSGTENCARIMIEGDNQFEIETYAQEIAGILKRELA